MKKNLLLVFFVSITYVVLAQDLPARDGSSMERSFLIKGSIDQVIYKEDAQLRRYFQQRSRRWKIVNRTIKSYGVPDCRSLREGKTKIMHLVEVGLTPLKETGTIYFDITDSYLKLCAGCPDDTIPEQNVIAEQMVY